MKKIKFFIYDAFSEEKFKGNPAAIILEADSLDEKDMLNIAKEINYSETAFLFKSKTAFKKVRFFTPNSEVDLCGHATIAYVKCLFDEGYLNLSEGENILNMETNVGVLPIIINFENSKIKNIMMYQDDGKIDYNVEVDKTEIVNSLSLNLNQLENLKIVKAYSGIWDLMIPLKSKRDLYNIYPKKEEIINISKKMNIISLHPFFLEKTAKGLEAYVRNFAPIVAINEEAATGTSNGALAYFLYKTGILKENEILTSIQGETMQRESKILSCIKNEKILVGGNAVKILEGYFEI